MDLYMPLPNINTIKSQTFLLLASKEFGLLVYANKTKYTCMFMRRYQNV
jgi:hypothetical protein